MDELASQAQLIDLDEQSPVKLRRLGYLQADPMVNKLCEVLRKFYWNRLEEQHNGSLKREPLMPLTEVTGRVLEAWGAGLDKREECAYAGSVLLFSVLEGTGRRFAVNLQEANELFMAGMRLASYLWELLEQSGGDLDLFDIKVGEISEYIDLQTHT